MQRIDVGINNNSEWSHKGIMLLDKQVYQNPYYPARMNDDEIAVASCLFHMKTYVESDTSFTHCVKHFRILIYPLCWNRQLKPEKRSKPKHSPGVFRK